ncbi:MAG: isoprenylcysteine carboxylmethyltransferase family protein [Synergistaceae bacterium]|jgi:protein-S-isoprenylcysteine O-methyltransferase Ste14|nr:isoprenylcysteine carboxylmethyltransferase family protein [Synergistaceae bacterium]
MFESLVSHRTKISQLLGVIFIVAFMFSDRKLEYLAPVVTDLMITAGCFLIGCATVGRLWCAQYIAGYKSDTLVTTGPYSICRNPLYFFSLLGGIGVGLCTESLTFAAVIVLVFAVIYPITISTEERRLSSAFGEAYDSYAASTPRFLPDVSKFHEPAEYMVNTKAYRREIGDAAFFVWVVGLFEIIEVFIKLNILPTYLSIY